MNQEELISAQELCDLYKVEYNFVRSLSESGLIEIITIEKREYVHCEKMTEFEKWRRLHYDLDINLEGIEAVQHLLQKIKKLQKANRHLRNRLNLYE